MAPGNHMVAKDCAAAAAEVSDAWLGAAWRRPVVSVTVAVDPVTVVLMGVVYARLVCGAGTPGGSRERDARREQRKGGPEGAGSGGLPRAATSGHEPPRAATSRHQPPRAAKSRHEPPRAATSRHEPPRAPEAATSSQSHLRRDYPVAPAARWDLRHNRLY